MKHDWSYEIMILKKCNELCRRSYNAWSGRRQQGLHEAPESWWCAVKTAWKSVCWASRGALRSDMMPRVDYLFKVHGYVVDMSARPSLTSHRLLRLLARHSRVGKNKQMKEEGKKKEWGWALNGHINGSFNQGLGPPDNAGVLIIPTVLSVWGCDLISSWRTLPSWKCIKS